MTAITLPFSTADCLLSIVVFAFVIYMIPGLWGAPLKSISAFLPPPATQDFDLSQYLTVQVQPLHPYSKSSIKEKKYEIINPDKNTRA